MTKSKRIIARASLPAKNDDSPTKEISLDDTQLIAGRFSTIKRLGSGGFGEVHLAKDHQQDELRVAIKFERSTVDRPQLPIERNVFELMHESVYFPKMFYFGVDQGYTILAMDLLGPSVEDLLNFCGRKLSSKTICMIVEQVLHAIEALHHRSLIHRDLKPDNFLFGVQDRSHQVHLIDFGLCKNYRHPLTHEHSAYRFGKSLMGTARYCSLFTHHGMEQSRRDDIECLAHAVIYLAKGTLPWMSIKALPRKKRNERFAEMKDSLTSKELCADLPDEFEQFHRYAKTLAFTQQPDYGYLRNLLARVISRLKEKFDYIYDWHLLVNKFIANVER